ncbi:NAD(P)H-binding protein [Leptolyngbya sp. AN03gr2]|uniref:NAD(P)H-binding protein n=1 Tax=unclassified Leptolyngbya TaxID=2650499 RepID=UPI003D31C53C
MILVTGGSGNIGKAVVEYLRDRQVPFRIGSRSPNSDEAIAFNFLDPNTFASAVQDCRAMFLLRPPAISDTKNTLNRLIDVARSQGVQHIVFISVAGAGDNPAVPHYATEQHLKQGEKDWTILRPGFFAQNLGDAYREDILNDDRIFLPAGAGRVAFIDTRDIAEVAAKILINSANHQGKTYTLTGAQASTFYEVAAMLSEELDRTITYHPASIPGYCLHLFRRKTPLEQILIFTILHVGLRFGQAETVDETLPQLLEHSSRSTREYIRDHRQLWLKSV